jgi:hypothetical protein
MVMRENGRVASNVIENSLNVVHIYLFNTKIEKISDIIADLTMISI